MNETYVALIVGLGAPTVAFLIYLFSRRATLRSVDATTDAQHVTAAAAIVVQLQEQIRLLIERQAVSDTAMLAERHNFTTQLTRAHEENSRISAMVAELRTELDITQRQIQALRAYLPKDVPDRTQMLFTQTDSPSSW